MFQVPAEGGKQTKRERERELRMQCCSALALARFVFLNCCCRSIRRSSRNVDKCAGGLPSPNTTNGATRLHSQLVGSPYLITDRVFRRYVRLHVTYTCMREAPLGSI